MPNDEVVSVRYMVDDVDESIAFYTKMFDFEIFDERCVRVRRCEARQSPPVALGADEFGGTGHGRRNQAGTGRMELHPLHRRRSRR